MTDPVVTSLTIRPKRTRKSSKPRASKVLDPGIAAIREKMALEVAAYRSAQASAKILDTLLTKRLPKLTAEDRQALYDELSKTETPALLAESPQPISKPGAEHVGPYEGSSPL